MNNIYQIYLISDSTGETLDRIFLAIKAQFNLDETLIKCKMGYKILLSPKWVNYSLSSSNASLNLKLNASETPL